MEKRALLAALLMAALLVVYQMFFFPAPQEAPTQKAPAPTPPAAVAQAPAPPPPGAAPAAPAAPTPAAPVVPRPEAPRPPQRLATADAPLYRAVVSSEGGKLQELVLRYRGEKPMILVGDLGPGGLIVAPDPSQPGEAVPMTLSAEQLSVRPERPSADLVLTGQTDGLRVRQTLRFHSEGYAIDVLLRVENPGAAPRTIAVSLPWLTRQAWRGITEKFQGQQPTEIVWAASGNVERIEDLATAINQTRDGDWIAMGSVWYLAAFVPQTPGFKLVAWSEGKPPEPKNGDRAPAGRASIAVRATPTATRSTFC